MYACRVGRISRSQKALMYEVSCDVSMVESPPS
jgi:hypothetical protein